MGSEKIILPKKEELNGVIVSLLKDVQALEKMLETDIFETNPIRIGAEQELCLIDKNFKPTMRNLEVLDILNHELFTTELAKFNMEANVNPLEFKGKCLSKMESDILALLVLARKTANDLDSDIILTGILPTIRKFDLAMENLTPFKRYKALVKAIAQLRGTEDLQLSITGIDELRTKHSSPLPEACNTGFQVHLQVTPDDFANKYNIAQAIAGPALAVGTNSILLFGRRLWHESRIALFRQAIDVRTTGDNLRRRSARVMFGNDWIKESVLEIYREDIMRFKVLLGSSEPQDSLKILENGGVPDLNSLMIHNSTVYRWNRPCYGVANGIPHLRIENRVLPSGPTVKDEMANAALWLGLMNGLDDQYKDIKNEMDFSDAKMNFLRACRNGMNTKFTWANSKKAVYASELLLKELIPIAREGLAKAKVDKGDINHYMDLLEDRVKSGQNGSQWMLNSFNALRKESSIEETRAAITASTVRQQKENTPVHEWTLASMEDLKGWKPAELIVEDFMQTDLFTVAEDDILELVAEMMDWQKLRYVPVEDENDRLVGLVTSRAIRRYLLKQYYENEKVGNSGPHSVSDLMIKNPMTISPEASIKSAISIMQENGIGCLPVVNKGELLGVITEQDYLKVAGRLAYESTNSSPKKEIKKATRKKNPKSEK